MADYDHFHPNNYHHNGFVCLSKESAHNLSLKLPQMHPLSTSPIMAAHSVYDDHPDHSPSSHMWVQGEIQEPQRRPQQQHQLVEENQPPLRMDRMSLFRQHNWGKGRRTLIESSLDNDSIGHDDETTTTRIVDDTTMHVDAMVHENESTDCGMTGGRRRRSRRSSKPHKQKEEPQGDEEDDEHCDMVSQQGERFYNGKNLRDHFKNALPDQSSTRTIQTSNLTAFTGDTDGDTITTNKQQRELGKLLTSARPKERTMSKSPVASKHSRRELRKHSSPKAERQQSSKLTSHCSESLYGAAFPDLVPNDAGASTETNMRRKSRRKLRRDDLRQKSSEDLLLAWTSTVAKLLDDEDDNTDHRGQGKNSKSRSQRSRSLSTDSQDFYDDLFAIWMESESKLHDKGKPRSRSSHRSKSSKRGSSASEGLSLTGAVTMDTLCNDDDRNPSEKGTTSRSQCRRRVRRHSRECQEFYDERVATRAGCLDNVESQLSEEKVERSLHSRRSSHRRKTSKRGNSVSEDIMLAMTTDANSDRLREDDNRDPKDRGKTSRSRSRRLSRSHSTDSQDLYDDPIAARAELVGNVETKSSEDNVKPRLRSIHRSSNSSRSKNRVADGISKSPTRRTNSHSVSNPHG